MVKCAECGFLAIRNKHTRRLDETEKFYRDNGTSLGVEPLGPYRMMPDQGSSASELHESQPICFAFKYDLEELIAKRSLENKETTVTQGIIKDEIQEERCCEAFVKWQQGFTPKEHREKLDRQEMLDYQARRDKEDKDWRVAQEDKARQWLERRERSKFRWEVFVFGGIVTAALIIGQLGAAFIERSGQPTVIVNTPPASQSEQGSNAPSP